MSTLASPPTRDVQGRFVPGTTEAGAPRKFQDIDSFQAAIDAYFERQRERDKPPTMMGLARALGCTRETLLNYSRYTDAQPFVEAVKDARMQCGEWLEERLYEPRSQPAGPIFSLKNNFGWRDLQEIQVDQRTVVMGVTISLEQHRAELAQAGGINELIRQMADPQNQAQLCEVSSAGHGLSPAAETASSPSPEPDIAVSVERPKAKATPTRGVSPCSVA